MIILPIWLRRAEFMNLDICSWKRIVFGTIIDEPYKAYAHTKIELDTSNEWKDGYIPFVTRTESNNGVDCYVPSKELQEIESGNAIVIGDTTATISYQKNAFGTGDHIVVIRAEWLNEYTGQFIVTLLQRERFRYSYGRAYLINAIKATEILLPVTDSEEPDWSWIENYVKSLHCKKISTKIKKPHSLSVNSDEWKEFYLHKLFNAGMGNGIDAVATTNENPKYNYVSRKSNSEFDFVDEIDGEKPFPAGSMTLALGGSLGSCFIHKKPFYTAQNVAVLQEKLPLSDHTKLFIATLIRNECKIKYQAFGRELNAHFRKDFTIKLPVKHNANGVVLDNTHEFSDEGYIPDWEWMDSYMKSLPYSDRI